MTDHDVNLQPDELDILQQQDAYTTAPPVPVAVCGPVRVQQLPRKAGATRTITPSQSVPVRILAADPTRARATLIGLGTFYIAYVQVDASDTIAMASWPANVPLVIDTVTDVWVMSDPAGANPIAVSVLTELWATGEGLV